jgi:hypothetical protein
MTKKRDLKRIIRTRAAKTGESYAAARHQVLLRRGDGHVGGDPIEFRRLDRADMGYALEVPTDWAELPPDTENSPWEVARYANRVHGHRVCIVFRFPARPGATGESIRRGARARLEQTGFVSFHEADARIAGRSAARLDCERRSAGRTWAVREYFAASQNAAWCLGFGSAAPVEDAPLFDRIAAGFELRSD